MSRYYPHSAYAEDQPLHYTILTVHVAMRALTAGTIIGLSTATVRHLVPALRPASASASALPFAARVLPAAFRGSAYTVGLLGLALVGRMWGREEIEWKDRSWRLLENKGQVECDDWTVGGMAVGGVWAAAARGQAEKSLFKRAIGGMGLGSVLGMAGYMGWRYGVNGGKFPEGSNSGKAERTSI